MIVADATWIIALRDPRDPHHRMAVTINNATVVEVIVLHPVTFAECLVADAPLRWARLRAATSLRLPDVIVLDTALVHGATAILTLDRELAGAATTRSIASPATSDGPTA